MQVVGEARSAEQAVEMLAAADADVVVLDHRLPGMDGHELCREMAERRLPGRVIMLSAYLDDDAVQGAFLYGARGYVIKDIDGVELRRAIRAVADGGSYLDSKLAGRIMGWAARRDRARLDSLRPKEVEILQHLTAGKTNRDIAKIVGVSRDRVASRLVVIFQKLGVKSRAEAVAVAIRQGLVRVMTEMDTPRAAGQ